MKIFQKFGFGLAFILAFTALAIAQTEKEQSAVPNKVVFIASEIFEDEEKGIKELVDAVAKLEIEFKPMKDELSLLYKRYEKLAKEFKDMATIESPQYLTKEIIEAKTQEFKGLETEIRKKQEIAKPLYKKRYAEVINPIKNKIQEAMKQFAKEKGYKEILDVSDLELVCYPRGIYVTDEFIKYYNSLAAKQQ